jgi:hypothetical protein
MVFEFGSGSGKTERGPLIVRANGLPPRRRPDALVRNVLWVLRASSSSFNNRTEPSSA